MRSLSSFATRAVAATAVLCMLVACGDKNAAPGGPGAGGPGGKPPPPQVGVITVKTAPVALQSELPGRVEAVRVAQVRARVNGVVLKRLFTEGSEVKQGQVLFQIDPAPYQAQLASARANLGKAQANLSQATAQANRYKPLAEANAVSKQEYDNVVAAQRTAQADVAAQRALVQIAQINTGYASVTAPIAGRIGRALVTEGALVSAAEATQLAVIQQTDSVFVNFTQSASELQRLRRAAGVNVTQGEAVPVSIIMDDGSELTHKGKLLFSDVTVDPTSGQVTLRAQVPNNDNMLLPGQYVRVRVAQAQVPAAILIPQQAVTRGSSGDTVVVVGADGKTQPRTIRVGSQQDGQWVVLEGLKDGEQVVVDGFQKLQGPGAEVKPVPWSAPATAQAPAPAAAAPAPAASR
ncbi:efflux RND transporter periplasmic adaptor subunit [Massilia sp. PAMC28688]|uniref:efflux RND transporter periplasmic adaptor subunit n=1 Tax=Massilia sp. PAMC28688 TaxID=2861283 RepID=UPI001C624CBC|nr:efflux RND transporter periplasmic adaptor subunit [Massilia sp. PAMC28688]QYF92068.1 efflux RND transporter periplasmic adaptor subunit [Massilia sp. PAMC28688]